MLGQQRQRGVGLVAHGGGHHAHRQRRARLDVVLARVDELVDLREALLHIPEQDHAQRGRRREHAVVLVLVQPGRVLDGHERVLPVAGVDEGVHKGGRQVRAGAVHLLAVVAAAREPRRLGQVALVDVLRGLGLHHVQVFGELEEELGHARIADHLVGLLVVGQLDGVPVPGEEVAHLLLDLRRQPLGLQQLQGRLPVVEAERQAQSVAGLPPRAVDRQRRPEHLAQVIRVARVVGQPQQVQAHALVVLLVDLGQPEQVGQPPRLHQQVHGLGLRVVPQVVRHDHRHQLLKIVGLGLAALG
mmetsp:Transcript_36083/g.62494  ORF Transcript_36083/g.62494 Transcript_36083/m.62494 type:complete len:301 (-) Transcript_36083:657-1559(-)